MKYVRNILLFTAFFISVSANAQNQDRIQIGFGATVKNVEIQRLLERNAVKPKAAFMWVSGLTVTHRDYENRGVAEFLNDVKDRTTTIFERGIKGSDERLKKFLEKHTEEDFLKSEELQEQARSLLNLRQQLENAVNVAKNDHPMVFAVEVEGSNSQIDKIKREKLVKSSLIPKMKSDKKSKLALKPEVFRNAYHDPLVTTLAPNDLYTLMSESVSSN